MLSELSVILPDIRQVLSSAGPDGSDVGVLPDWYGKFSRVCIRQRVDCLASAVGRKHMTKTFTNLLLGGLFLALTSGPGRSWRGGSPSILFTRGLPFPAKTESNLKLRPDI